MSGGNYCECNMLTRSWQDVHSIVIFKFARGDQRVQTRRTTKCVRLVAQTIFEDASIGLGSLQAPVKHATFTYMYVLYIYSTATILLKFGQLV